MFNINDKSLISDINNEFAKEIEKREEEFPDKQLIHPLDSEIREKLDDLVIGEKDTMEYSQVKQLDELWILLINKAIKCLRFFDDREPFLKNEDKKPVVYGIDKLQQYHKRYASFESLLYGASSYYRDHVFHAVRTWMLGVFCLLKPMRKRGKLLIDQITIDGCSDEEFSSNIKFFEKISMWTLIALCHDLGYPLEKSQQILDKTQKMMEEFIPNPNIWNNFGFSGVQDNINEYIIKFMSTKMMSIKKDDNKEKDKKGVNEKKKDGMKSTSLVDSHTNNLYYGRVQPKYYLKYTKSLEHFDHGVISSVLIYKMLLYFLESDFNLNDDYEYKYEDARQFYIRREILRAMASHTCSDIYNIYLTTFSSILFLCDELQEWGRKSWNELYSGLQPNAVKLSIEKFSPKTVSIKEEIDMQQIDEEQIFIDNIKRIYERQYAHYKVIFRDGQYTQAREFNFKKQMDIQLKQNGTEENKIIILYELKAQEKNYFRIDLSNSCQYNNQGMKDEIEKNIISSEYPDEIEVIFIDENTLATENQQNK